MIDWLTGRDVGWTRNTSFSRTFSRIRTKMFSLANLNTSARPGSMPTMRDLARQIPVGVAVVDLELVRVHGCLPFAEGRHERPFSGPAGVSPPGWGSSLSPMTPWSASPARKAEMAATGSPSPSRITITPRAAAE